MAFQKTNQGYDVTATQKATPQGANGLLESGISAASVDLWVYEVSTGFAMSGTTGQSARTRTFFPHNFVQPVFTVMCQAPNQEIYANTIEFIRKTQITFDFSLKLTVFNARHHRDLPRYAANSIKGRHFQNQAIGYIKSAPRSHQRHTYAPEFQFSFIVSRYLQPANWADKALYHTRPLKSWKDVIENSNAAPYAQDPDAKVGDSVAPYSDIVHVAPGPGGGLRPF